MSTPIITSICAFIGVVALVQLIATLSNRKPAAVRRRLQDHAVAVESPEAQRLERIKVLKIRGIEDSTQGGSKVGRSKVVRTAARELARAGVSTPVRQYLFIRIFVGIVFAVAAQIFASNILITLVALLAGIMVPRILVRRTARRRLAAFEAQLAEAIDLLVGALRAGHGFLQGLESVTNQMEDPTKGELARVLEEVNIGISPVESLMAMNARIPSYDVGLLVSAIAIQRQTGGNLAEVLENLASTIRERRRIRAEVLALTTGPRVSSFVLAALPVGLFLYFVAISSDYRETMLNSTFGHLLLGMVAVLTALGLFFTRKVSKVEY